MALTKIEQAYYVEKLADIFNKVNASINAKTPNESRELSLESRKMIDELYEFTKNI